MSIFLVIILVIVVLFVYLYNGLVNFNNKVKTAWFDLETQLKKRYDLIATLTEIIKDPTEIEKLNTLRAKAMQATSLIEKAEAEMTLSEMLNTAIAGSEKAQELKEIEDEIQTARRFYNGTARDLNIKLITIPTNFIASKLGFKKAELFATQSEIATELKAVAPTPEPAPMPTQVTEVAPEPQPEPIPEPQVEQPITPTPQPEPTTVEPEPAPEQTPIPEQIQQVQPQEPQQIQPTEAPETIEPELVPTPQPETTPESESIPAPQPTEPSTEAPAVETPPQQ